VRRALILANGILFFASAVLLGATLVWIRWSYQREDVWSISIYSGGDPFSLKPHPLLARNPALTAADVTGVRADFVADPFIVRHGATWYMFFEALESESRRGIIGLASSDTGLTWHYETIVLREPFHLSYPHVFEWQDAFYMIPESAEASAVRLYRATDFPYQWQFVGELLAGKYWDPSIVRHEGLWWLFALDETASLTLHYASQLQGVWTAHPQSPVVKHSLSVARPGGRVIVYQNKVVRYTQDGTPTYGSSLRAFQVDEMTTVGYREHEVSTGPVLAGSGKGWNATGMHHADLCQLDDGSWLASVDGNRQRLVFNWRAGARRIVNSLCDALPRR
jgi:hypothetical protein